MGAAVLAACGGGSARPASGMGDTVSGGSIASGSPTVLLP